MGQATLNSIDPFIWKQRKEPFARPLYHLDGAEDLKISGFMRNRPTPPTYNCPRSQVADPRYLEEDENR